MKIFHKRKKGMLGEKIASNFLDKRGYKTIDRNYQKKWGEIDIVALKDNVIHFVEVKSVTHFSGIGDGRSHRPEENVDGWKVKHMRRMIETYLEEKGYGLDKEFQFHIISVFMNMNTKKASIKWLENVII